MRLLALLVAFAGGCDGCTPPGTESVYECTIAPEVGGDTDVELCSDLNAAELGARLGGRCYPTRRHIGWCLHSCPPPARGCNAKNGCFCENP